MSKDFRDWLTEELNRRGWSKSELARQAGLSPSIVSKMLLGDRNITADQCIKLAQALGLSPVLLLVKAGILPPQESSNDPTIEELLDIARQLPGPAREELLSYARFKLRESGSDS